VQKALVAGSKKRLAVLMLILALSSGGARAARTPAELSIQSYLPLVRAGGIWRPALNTSWQIQFSDLPIDQSVDAAMYDIDLFDNDASVVAALHAQGRKVVCYFSAGSWEEWRPDAGQFPEAVKGKGLVGWPGEQWLDIRESTCSARSCKRGWISAGPRGSTRSILTISTGMPTTQASH
jgi:hypothetical protein